MKSISILLIIYRDKRVLYTKFRIGIAPLRIETGRHEHNPAKPGTPGI